MPVRLVPDQDIPKLAGQIVSPLMLKMLRRLKERGFIQDGSGNNGQTSDALLRLTDLGLADPGFKETPAGQPFIWVSNANGERVLKHLESKRHYKIGIASRARTALAALSDDDRDSVLSAIDWLVLHEKDDWPHELALRISQDEPVYLVRVTGDLRAFIKVHAPSAKVQLFDLAREEALNLFR